MKIVRIVGIVIAVALTILFGAETFTTVAADEIVVKQGFFTGALTVWTDPGPKFQNFGTHTVQEVVSILVFSGKRPR